MLLEMALMFYSSVDSAERWRAQFARLAPEIEMRVWPEIGDPAAIDHALVWRPAPGLLASLPNLKLILSLGAGADHLLRDPLLPRALPIVRLVDPYLTDAMSEYVVLQVLRLHRQDLEYSRPAASPDLAAARAEERRRAAGRHSRLRRDRAGCAGESSRGSAFPISGWSSRAKSVDGVATYAGGEGLPDFLANSEILVCLLPLTSATQGILCARTFAALPAGAGLVNAGRGGHLVEEDLMPALDSGRLSAAALDVFGEEPLPEGHPFWRHPRILITPHVAGTTNPATAAPIVLDNLRRFADGRPLLNRVDPALEY